MNNDLISREALRKKLQARYDNGEEDFDRGYNLGIAAAIELLDSAPTIEPFERIGSICEENCGYRPQGEWKSEGGFVFCNQCGSSHGVHKTNFCPNCGAKMKGGAE